MYTTQPWGNPTPLMGQPAAAPGMSPTAPPGGGADIAAHHQALMNAYAQHLLSQNAWGRHFQMGQQLYNSLFAHQPAAAPGGGGAANPIAAYGANAMGNHLMNSVNSALTGTGGLAAGAK